MENSSSENITTTNYLNREVQSKERIIKNRWKVLEQISVLSIRKIFAEGQDDVNKNISGLKWENFFSGNRIRAFLESIDDSLIKKEGLEKKLVDDPLTGGILGFFSPEINELEQKIKEMGYDYSGRNVFLRGSEETRKKGNEMRLNFSRGGQAALNILGRSPIHEVRLVQDLKEGRVGIEEFNKQILYKRANIYTHNGEGFKTTTEVYFPLIKEYLSSENFTKNITNENSRRAWIVGMITTSEALVKALIEGGNINNSDGNTVISELKKVIEEGVRNNRQMSENEKVKINNFFEDWTSNNYQNQSEARLD